MTSSNEHFRPSEPVQSENFFRSLTLGEIYSQPQLTHWVPHYTERQFLLQLAHAITDGKDKPTILDAACGSGFVSKLLAADNQANVIGIDPGMEEMGSKRLGTSLGNVQFITTDLWDTLDQFSPQIDSEIGAKRRKLLARIREDYTQNGPVFAHLYHDLQSGTYARLSGEAAELQELNRAEAPSSSVDLVICSFMPPRIDLTIPIRDGIYPKAIVYIRTPLGFVGAGDFYQGGENTLDDETGEKDAITPDTVISLNPGRNYSTSARWRTSQANDWLKSNEGFRYLLGGEVIVQLRNDVVLRPVKPLSLEGFGFDDEVGAELEQRRLRAQKEKLWGSRNIDFDFQEGINSAANTLFYS